MKGSFVFDNLLGRISGSGVVGHLIVRAAGTDAAPVVVSPVLRSLPRSHWHWLYLQHLAETVASIPGDGDAAAFVARALLDAQTVCTQSSWAATFAPEIARAMRRAWWEGAGDEPARAPAGGSTDTGAEAGGFVLIEIVQDDGALPRVRVARPRIAGHLKRVNLALLRHVLDSAADSLEQFQLCRQIEMLARYYRATSARSRRSRSALRNAPVFAVLHADVARLPSTEGLVEAPPVLPAAAERRRPPAALGALTPAVPLAACLSFMLTIAGGSWLLLSSAGAPRPERLRTPGAAVGGGPSVVTPEAIVMALPQVGERPRPTGALQPAGRRRAAAAGAFPAAPQTALRKNTRKAPRRTGGPFQVRSQPLAKVVATQRVRVLAEHGIRSYVRPLPGQLAEIDYGWFDSKAYAESRALGLRQQGYTAVVVPSDAGASLEPSRQPPGGGSPGRDSGP
jgi:hypothetical protein